MQKFDAIGQWKSTKRLKADALRRGWDIMYCKHAVDVKGLSLYKTGKAVPI